MFDYQIYVSVYIIYPCIGVCDSLESFYISWKPSFVFSKQFPALQRFDRETKKSTHST